MTKLSLSNNGNDASSQTVKETGWRDACACGIAAAGITDGGICYVLAGDAVSGVTPNAWAMNAIAPWRRLEADALVAEVNQGGEMVRAVINEVDSSEICDFGSSGLSSGKSPDRLDALV